MKWLVVLLLFSGILSSCEKEAPLKNANNTATNDYTVNLTDAKSIAQDLLTIQTNSLQGTSITSKKVDFIEKVPDKNNKPAYYIINYEEGGFVILAGDKRSSPILAYSKTGHFETDADKIPTGLVNWLWNKKENIEHLRKGDLKRKARITKEWINLSEGQSIVNPDPPTGPTLPGENDNGEGTETEYIFKGPFLETTWGQRYNSQMPELDCNPTGYAYTGCVTTAVAQVMKYQQKPNTYDWASMPNEGHHYSNEIAQLMRDIFDATEGAYYNCGGTGASISEAGEALRETFGYANVKYSGFNRFTLTDQLSRGLPVILRGSGTQVTTGWWIFSETHSGPGHAWVCDGYMKIVYSFGSGTMYHMNWGWFGHYNAYYRMNNLTPGEHDYKYGLAMLYWIK